MRQIVLDTETTGLEPEQGHRIIEIGCVEIVNRRLTGNHYHQYLQPDREIDAGAVEVHGITSEFLADKPRFNDVMHDFLAFVSGAELIIHNAPFDVGFINHELRLVDLNHASLDTFCSVMDTLQMARRLHPGQKNSLDALCKRYGIDNSQRSLHGALLDAEILADVYLSMTGGQVTLELETAAVASGGIEAVVRNTRDRILNLPVIRATADELAAHKALLERIREASGGECLWDQVEDLV
ncbi:MAG TPA: DNA polymerase III subunit epsilon [Gammaproteobacteria bacterium]